MSGASRSIPVTLVTLHLLAGALLASVAQAQGSSGGRPVARIGDEVITLEEVEDSVSAQLAELEQKRHALIANRLDELIGERLLTREAKRRGISVEQLLKEEVHAKTPEVTDAEVSAFMTQNRARLPRAGDETQLRLKVWDLLRSQRVGERRAAYVATLRARSQVVTSLPEPPSPRLQLSSDTSFVRGLGAAPVVIVEFSDFQCPFCKGASRTITQLLDMYRGKVKWVFRDFPIESLHPTAPRAHEAARCAGAQGKFWEYHDLLFERSPRHAPEELRQYAGELGLDGAAFARCLDSGRYRGEITRDIQEGTRVGVRSTPTFFINGRKLIGAKPLSAFQQLIESELAKHTP